MCVIVFLSCSLLFFRFLFSDSLNKILNIQKGVLCKKVLLEISQNLQENICASVSFSIKLLASACNFIKKETLAHVFSCEFCEISKNTFLTEHLCLN